MAPVTLADLLKEPFGPYWDHDVLSEACKCTPRNMLTLTEVMLACGDEPIGLTLCERTQPECQEDRLSSEGPVLLRGVLDIASLSWLSEHGRKVVQDDLDEREMQWHISNKRVKKGKITLENLYNVQAGSHWISGRTVKVCIQGLKCKPAVHMGSDLVPDGLMIQLEDQNRSFHVQSMDVETYALSRLYLARYRLLHDMRDLIRIAREQSDKNISNDDLTFEWYVKQYLQHKAATPYFHEHRLIHDSDEDSDVEPKTIGQLKLGKSRRLRHVSRAEARSLFAMHARWLVHDQRKVKFQKSRVINLESWKASLQECKRWRESARREDPETLFGVFDKNEQPNTPLDESEDEDDQMDVDEEVQPPIRPPTRKRKRPEVPSRIRSPASEASLGTASNRSSRSSTRLASAAKAIAPRSLSPPEDNGDEIDSDVTDSEASTPPYSDSDDDDLPPHLIPPSPTLVARISQEILHPPELPAYSFTWHCPVPRCTYLINLLDISLENCEGLANEDILTIKESGWNLSDELIQRIFVKMVDIHYHRHLDYEGIKLVEDAKGRLIGFDWKVPEAHPFTRSTVRQRRGDTPVKEED